MKEPEEGNMSQRGALHSRLLSCPKVQGNGDLQPGPALKSTQVYGKAVLSVTRAPSHKTHNS